MGRRGAQESVGGGRRETGGRRTEGGGREEGLTTKNSKSTKKRQRARGRSHAPLRAGWAIALKGERATEARKGNEEDYWLEQSRNTRKTRKENGGALTNLMCLWPEA